MNHSTARDPAPRHTGLFAAEIRTRDWDRAVAWYRDQVGLESLVRIPDDLYALLGGAGGRLAILGRGDAGPASPRWSLAIEVPDLSDVQARLAAMGSPAPAPEVHPEGYRYFVTQDPDGNRVVLLAWPDHGQ